MKVCMQCYRNSIPDDQTYCQTCRPTKGTEKEFEIDAEIEAVLLTTETNPDLKILERIEIITAECVFGMNIFKDIFASIRDIVGGRSKAFQDTLRDARKTALYELKREAHEVGANAVVGVDLDYSEISGGRRNMLFLVASGTAVRIEGQNNGPGAKI